ncbi:MAG: nucleotidyltransferase domain-containing protein [Chloroflexi bacterium]|nr:nucleotidyltransferase domain-containing protein [Chloroflexota bacterium]
MLKRIDWASVAQVFDPFPNVIAAWAFGSAQDGEIREGGDVDIAVLFHAIPSLDERAGLRAALQTNLQFDDIDLLVLNGASPITRFEAISGHSIYCRDVWARAEFDSLTAREYEDAIAFLQWGLESYLPA